MMTPEQIREKVKTIIQLPALPSLAFEVVEMVDDPKTSAAQLGKLIAADQALAGKVLKIANSPFYGFPKKISTIDFAIIVLGFDALKEIVISIALVSSLQKKADGYFNTKTFWDHSISTGVIARRLARDIGYRVTGEVFVAGLIHDMGISILNKYFNIEFRRIVDITREMGLSFAEAEESVLGVTHAEIGGWLGERWNLPDQLVETIRFHHTPEKAESNKKLVSIVHCADVFAKQLMTEKVEYDSDLTFSEDALETLQLNDQNLIQEYLFQYSDVVKSDLRESLMVSNLVGM
ncbi:MAG: HDOD domain-containing protein [Bacteroidota bacterium]